MALRVEQKSFVTATQGFAAFQMYFEANEELNKVDPDCRHLPEVLAVRLEIYESVQKWELAEAVAERLAEDDPDSVPWVLACEEATSRADLLEVRRGVLLNALNRYDSGGILHKLACLECQLGNVAIAKDLLKTRFEIDAGCKCQALEETALKDVWE